VSVALATAVALYTSAPRATLSASPARIALVPGARRLVHIEAAGTRSVVVGASVAGFTLDARGRPRIVRPGDAAPWLAVAPRAVSVGRTGATVVVSSRSVGGARPGDHTAVVLLTAVQPSPRGVLVRMRVGLVVSVRVPGRIVRSLGAVAVHVARRGRRRTIDVALANRGNVIEHVTAELLRIELVRSGRVVAGLRAARRDLLPHSKGVMAFAAPPKLHGPVILRIELRRVVRRFHLRL
jgi:hypothetical protein